MSTPTFTVAVRDVAGQSAIFRISHAEIQTHEQVIVLVREEIPDAQVILVGMN